MQPPKSSKDQPNHLTQAQPASWGMLWQHPAYMLGLGFGSGLSPKAPGTIGTLLAWVLFIPLNNLLPSRVLIAVIFVSVPIGWWACTQTASKLRTTDPSCIVWDEIAAFWLLLWAVESTLATSTISLWLWHILAFIAFRFFDAAKPQPVRWADRIFQGNGLRGGWGIMFDDLVAAGCAYVLLLLISWF